MAMGSLFVASLGALATVLGTPPGFPPSLKPGCLERDANNTDLYCPGDLGYGCYKIPTILRTLNGTLLAMIEARKFSCDDQGFVDLRLRRSSDGGETWGGSTLMYTNSTETQWTTVGDGNWVQDESTGTIWLLHTRNNSQLFLSHSVDDGISWSEALDVSSYLKKGYPTQDHCGTGHAGGIQLSAGPSKGRLIIPTYAAVPYIVYSDDKGVTWKQGGAVPNETYFDGGSANEWTLAETGTFGADGTPVLLASIRNSPNIPFTGHRLHSLSKDGGISWGPVWEAKELPEPIRGCEGSLLYHPMTHKIYFSHPDPSLDLFRNRLRIWTTTDLGKSWQPHAVVWEKAAGYSSMVLTKNGDLGVFYDRNNHTMAIFEAQSVSWTKVAP
eukprot:Hpha_TRINITY_DN30319_c0_g1::TRINITY_DN30319_c0_g1_i1::g.146909::m.146909/K01186/NEU1; sialidase-1